MRQRRNSEPMLPGPFLMAIAALFLAACTEGVYTTTAPKRVELTQLLAAPEAQSGARVLTIGTLAQSNSDSFYLVAGHGPFSEEAAIELEFRTPPVTEDIAKCIGSESVVVGQFETTPTVLLTVDYIVLAEEYQRSGFDDCHYMNFD